jgi:hypothetical protein
MKFIVVRFAPGSGGKFISTLLQLSPDVNPWSDEIHSTQVTDWFKQRFTGDFVNWLKLEPEIPYQTNFVSNRFDRGNDITVDTALELLNNDLLFQQHWRNNKKICLILNKSQIPQWIQGNCSIVNVAVDGVDSKKWVNRCRLNKQFLRKNNNTWIIKQDHPDYCSQMRSAMAQKFNNPREFSGTAGEFLKKYVVNDPLVSMFTDPDAIVAHASNNNEQQIFINLSEFIQPNKSATAVERICQQLNIQIPNLELVEQLSFHYWKIHKSIIEKGN